MLQLLYLEIYIKISTNSTKSTDIEFLVFDGKICALVTDWQLINAYSSVAGQPFEASIIDVNANGKKSFGLNVAETLRA